VRTTARTSDHKLAEIFDSISKVASNDNATFIHDSPETIFVYDGVRAEAGPDAQSTVLTQRDFTIQAGSER
jgi:hypothetical protein